MRGLLAVLVLAAACSRPGSAPSAPDPGASSGMAAVNPSQANRFAEQAYLEAVADFRRGDFSSAADKFSRCLTLVTTGQTAGGCMAGLELTRGALERGAPAPRAAASAAAPAAGASDDAAAAQSFLEGVIYFQKGDYEKARASWTRCSGLATPGTAEADDCRAGLERIVSLYRPRSTAPDGKK